VFENVAFGLKRRRVARDQVRGRVVGILKIVGLSGADWLP